ncbi:MAG: Outer membrane protein OprM [Candidatus Ordinivivax streblomastigis]|uniref:Outer membrane protein OprM n=1 Tax=Candidatus Ordinivivax streblomastigis TaxID=2540710 RepID=A0A5M8P188_9BACT|nr:MAG: Outer membrane protein OprM [Candidatus Ordinivivax streblomastigis]
MKVHVGKKFSMAAIAILSPWLMNAQNTSAPLEVTLDRAIEIALSENPSVKIADLEVQKKKYAKQSAQSALYPQIDAVGQYSRTLKKQVMYMDGAFNVTDMMEPLINGIDETFAGQNPGYVSGETGELYQNIARNTPPPTGGDDGISIGRDNNWSGGFQLNWPIVVPTLWKSLEINSLDLEVAVENARSSKINMVNSVRKAYYGALFAKDVIQVYQQNYDNAVLTYNDINNKFKQGIVAEFDLIRADVNAKNIKPNLIQAQNAYNIAILSLKALMGIDMDQTLAINGSLSDYEQDLYSDLLRINKSLDSNSDLMKFDIQNEQLQKSLTLYKMQYYPTIAITGNYMFMSMNNDFKFGDYKWNPTSSIALNISIPIFDGLKKHKDIQQTKVNLEQLKWQREDIVRNLKLSVDNNINTMTNYVEQVLSTKDVVAQAQKGYEISQRLYDTGMGTLLDLNTAQLGLVQASLAFNQAIYNFLASKADLDKTLGIEINK